MLAANAHENSLASGDVRQRRDSSVASVEAAAHSAASAAAHGHRLSGARGPRFFLRRYSRWIAICFFLLLVQGIIFYYVPRDEPGVSKTCPSLGKEAESAVTRASSPECKDLIRRIDCLNQADELFPVRLPNLCPVNTDARVVGNDLGCYEDSFSSRLLTGSMTKLKEDNSREVCLRLCTESGFLYAGLQYGEECFCGNDRPDPALRRTGEASKCDMVCPGDGAQRCGGYLAMNIYQTGLIPFHSEPIANGSSPTPREPVRIVFLLTVSGRAVRQVRRLIKVAYRRQHYFLIHVDSRHDYMFRELGQLERLLPNVRLVRQRFATIWGGASLLKMLLHSMGELLAAGWDWDYVINLSESDYILKETEDLVAYLSANRGRNFVKSHGRETQSFVKKQGLDRTFVECDNHMWRVGPRKLPVGIQLDGGSDWVCLHRDFVSYVIGGDDELLRGLRTVFEFALLPGEAFFHVALRNSHFCSTAANNNLKITNWKRKQGCKCQHKAVVDWCGCSPNDFLSSDWKRINATASKDLFFGRKFEASVNQDIINTIDDWLEIPNASSDDASRDSYWESLFHHLDVSPRPKAEEQLLGQSLAEEALALRASASASASLVFHELLELTSYYASDKLSGILVRFRAKSKDGTLELEALARPGRTARHFAFDERRLEVAVGTAFDPKELIFRNVLQVLGRRATPHVLVRAEEGLPAAFTVVWLDPHGGTSGTKQLSLNESRQEDGFSLDLGRSAATPGVWTVMVVAGDTDVRAVMHFLVISSLQELMEQPRAPAPDLSDKYFPLLREAVTDLDDFAVPALGSEVKAWLRRAAKRFFEPVDLCLVAKGSDVGNVDTACTATPWSSLFPDPKSTIGGFEALSGRLV